MEVREYFRAISDAITIPIFLQDTATAPIGAGLASGEFRPESLGPRVSSVIPSWIEEPSASKHGIAGVIVAGMHTSEVFIENGRFHGGQIAADIAAKLSPAEG